MRVLRPVLVVALLVVAVSGVPAQARIPRPVELTATTVVTTARSGYLDVVVPVDARVSPRVAANPDVRISGRGRYVGVWLERVEEGQASFGDGLSAIRLPSFAGGAQSTYGSYSPAGECTGVPEAYPVHWDCTDLPEPEAILLHEGRYRLTVLADGSPLTVTLSLHGLDEGTTELSPTTTLASAQKALPRLDAVGDTLVTFGATAPVAGNVSGTVLLTAKGSAAPVVEGVSSCQRQDAGAPPPFAYSARCEGGTGGGYSYRVNAGGQGTYVMGAFVSTGGERSAPVGLGGSVSDSGGVVLGDTLGVWLQVP
jgi:hypothetical protein